MQDTASEGYATSDEESSSESGESPAAGGSDDDMDMEDLGGRVVSGKAASTSQAASQQPEPEAAAAREMLTPALRANLSKQGYKLIGRSAGGPLLWAHSLLLVLFVCPLRRYLVSQSKSSFVCAMSTQNASE